MEKPVADYAQVIQDVMGAKGTDGKFVVKTMWENDTHTWGSKGKTFRLMAFAIGKWRPMPVVARSMRPLRKSELDRVLSIVKTNSRDAYGSIEQPVNIATNKQEVH